MSVSCRILHEPFSHSPSNFLSDMPICSRQTSSIISLVIVAGSSVTSSDFDAVVSLTRALGNSFLTKREITLSLQPIIPSFNSKTFLDEKPSYSSVVNSPEPLEDKPVGNCVTLTPLRLI